MKRFFKYLGFLLLIVVLIVMVRTFMSRSLQLHPGAENKTVVADSALHHLAAVLMDPTVSFDDTLPPDSITFSSFQEKLARFFPLVESRLTKFRIGNWSLVYRWNGSDTALAPIVFLAHQDVVPAPAEDSLSWEHPAFSGIMDNKFVWGRGSIDDKGNVMSMLEAAEQLIQQGFIPKQTIYFCFGHDEEKGGRNGAKKIAQFLEEQKIHARYILDEGTFIAQGIVPGIDKPVALIGIAEKGSVSVELSVNKESGHSSMPAKQTAIGILSGALAKLQDQPFPPRICEPVKSFMKYLGPEMPFTNRMAFANTWLFSPLIYSIYSKSGSGNATIRTTMVPTIVQGGIKENVVPSRARAILNCRILPGETIQSVMEGIRSRINNPDVKIILNGEGDEPSKVSDPASMEFKMISEVTGRIYPDALVVPSLMIAATDSRHYQKLSDHIFRFSPFLLQADDLARFHGTNERISNENFENAIRFYELLIKKSNQ